MISGSAPFTNGNIFDSLAQAWMPPTIAADEALRAAFWRKWSDSLTTYVPALDSGEWTIANHSFEPTSIAASIEFINQEAAASGFARFSYRITRHGFSHVITWILPPVVISVASIPAIFLFW